MKRQREIDRKVVQQERGNLEPVLTSPGPGSKDSRSPVIEPQLQQNSVHQQQHAPPAAEPEEPEPMDAPRLPEFGRAKYSFHPQGPG